MFDAIASRYDTTNRVLSLGQDLRWRRQLAKHLPRGNIRLLDIATGSGDQLIALCTRELIDAIGIDQSEAMLDLARKKAPHLTWEVGDAEKLRFKDGAFDAVTCSFGIRNMDHPDTALREMARVLRTKGRALILEFSLPKWPVRPIYLVYLRHILPRLGGALSRSTSAYRYLNQTIESFPSGRAFERLVMANGFSAVTTHTMALGAVSLYVAEK
ncbi:MAG: hypothetical protein RL235_39 [Chlamydiota bacterium]|jgi:demethylmenaquinone methyltransferase/2-methoxy-6-polyprenyl-1,4-benzoquinol methylase